MMFKNLKGAGEAIVLAVTDVRGKRGGDPYCSCDLPLHCSYCEERVSLMHSTRRRKWVSGHNFFKKCVPFWQLLSTLA